MKVATVKSYCIIYYKIKVEKRFSAEPSRDRSGKPTA
jgi:hypothetical protein